MTSLPRHPNIVQIYAVGTRELTGLISGSKTVIEMEWIDGDTLATLLKGPIFNTAQLKRICIGVCEGLRVMHENSVFHGDLHPGNIMVDDS